MTEALGNPTQGTGTGQPAAKCSVDRGERPETNLDGWLPLVS